MLKALWFLVKVSLLVALIVWFLKHPGTVSVDWLGYAVDMSVGFVAATLLAFLLAYTVIYRFWRGVITTPASVRRSTSRSISNGASASGAAAVIAVYSNSAPCRCPPMRKRCRSTPPNAGAVNPGMHAPTSRRFCRGSGLRRYCSGGCCSSTSSSLLGRSAVHGQDDWPSP